MSLAQLSHADSSSSASPENSESNIQIYETDFFVSAQPQTALDMLNRVPGFTIDGGNSDVRGFSGSAGNVLIDGQRPASKYDGVQNVLKRIKATSVLRIELIKGSAPGIDMQGQAVVVNIIRSTETTVGSTLDAGLSYHADGRLMPSGQYDISWRANGRMLEVSAKGEEKNQHDSGNGFRRSTNTSGQIIHNELSDVEASEKRGSVTVGYEQPALGGNLRLLTVLVDERNQLDEDIERLVPSSSMKFIAEDKDKSEVELGMYFNRDFGTDKQFALLAIQHWQTNDEVETETRPFETTMFENNSRSGESVVRAAITQPLAQEIEIKWGLEGAYNFLDSTSTSKVNEIIIPLPNSTAEVSEIRAEAFSNFVWAPRDNVNMQLGLAAEYSAISQAGENASTRSLSYFKPSLMFNWGPTDTDQFRGSIQREVGQLNFGDFVTSAELDTGTVNLGNPELAPDTSWVLGLTWERSFMTHATATFGLQRKYISDVVDIVPIYVPIEGTSEVLIFGAVGNIGSGTIDEAQFGLSLPFDDLGISGGLLQADVTYTSSDVQDPLTGEQRSISGVRQPWRGSVKWTQDLPVYKFRWGAEVYLARKEKQFRIDEVQAETTDTFFGLSAEYFPSTDWSVSLGLQNLTSRNTGLKREFYDAPRGEGAVVVNEVQSWKSEPYVYLRLHWQIL